MRVEDILDIPVKEEKEAEKKSGKSNDLLDMIIAFDTTGSMRAYIEDVKNHVTELIPILFKDNPNINIGIVAFGDYCDMPNKNNFGKAYQTINLTDDQEDLINFIRKAKNTNGGDGDEFYELVLKKVIEETSWRKDSKKLMLLIADADPHEIGYSYKDIVVNNQIDWEVEAKKASELGLQIDTLSINKWANKWLESLSMTTNGVNLPFKSSGKTNDLIRTSALSRGGEVTRDAFYKSMASYASDAEMSAVHTAYEKKIIE